MEVLELDGLTARIDTEDYYLEQIRDIMGILLHLTGTLIPTGGALS